LRNLSEEEKIKIIQTGFRLNQEGKISLKKYYEGASNPIQLITTQRIFHQI